MLLSVEPVNHLYTVNFNILAAFQEDGGKLNRKGALASRGWMTCLRVASIRRLPEEMTAILDHESVDLLTAHIQVWACPSGRKRL
jgi:hypothetical protein